MLADLVVDPAEFFADRDLRPGWPLAIFALTFGLGVLTKLLRDLADGPSGLASSTGSSAVAWIVVPPLFWLVFVAVYYVVTFHMLAEAFDGTGLPRDTLAVVGWGFAPKLFAIVSKTGLSLWLVVLEDSRLVAGVASELVITGGAGLILLVALAVSTAIWFHGMAAAHDLDRRDAALVVGIPVSLAALFDLFVLVFGFAEVL